MLYTVGEIVDEHHHSKYHESFMKSLKFNWQNPRILKIFDDYSMIVAVRPGDPKFMLKKVDELFSVADMELGIRVNLEASMKPSSMYLLYIQAVGVKQTSKSTSLDKRIAGFTAAEEITIGSPLVSENPLSVSTSSKEAEIGINRLWVHPNYRKQGIATHLLDVLRANFIKDKIVLRSKMAFSDATATGIEFAKRYAGTPNFLIFQYQN